MRKNIVIFFVMVIFMSGLAGLAAFLLYNGYVRFNYPSLKEYPVQGLDVSNHQGEIDWKKVDKKCVRFSFIKATEGRDFKDKSFERNWENAKKQNIIVGAYHFFTFCRSGEEQARNFIESVPNDGNMLPPAIDLEYSGNCKLTKTKQELLSDIHTFIDIIEKHYSRRVIIYVIDDFYRDYLEGEFPDNPYWLRGIYGKPETNPTYNWTFWQYSNRGRMDGIEGFVDLNVFKGTEDDFFRFLNAD